jgi:peptidyl-prolyl cis-trans isomerase A (cyclophilin A)
MRCCYHPPGGGRNDGRDRPPRGRLGWALRVVVALAVGIARAAAAGGHPVVLLSTSLGDVTIELRPDQAPVTVENFLRHVRAGYYDGTIFHRVVPNFMVQGGGLGRDLVEKREGQGPPIKSESGNGLSNEAGAVSMARMSAADTARTQFFINLRNNPPLDKDKAMDGVGYAVFGKVVAGMDVLRKMAAVRTTVRGPYANIPVEPIVLESARVVSE